MAKTNVVVINSDEANSTMAFDNPGSLIAFAGQFLDDVDSWSIPCEVIIVHKNGTVIRQRLIEVGRLVEFFEGYCTALWLSNPDPAQPVLDWSKWSGLTTVKKVYDSRT